MFTRIPQRLTGLLGDDAKLAFPSQPGGILKLASTRNISEADNYWNQYFVLFDSASEVFSLITPQHIRRALHDAPENVATLIRVTANRLFMLVSDHNFPSPPNGTVASFATSFIKASTATDRQTTKEVLNCLRILQRVLPVLFETDGESSVLEAELLWKKEELEEEEDSAQSNQPPQFVIDDEEEEEDDDDDDDDDDDEEEDDESSQAPKSPEQSKLKKKLPSLAERLFSTLIDLMFCCGFTLPTKIQVDHHRINYVIWEKGVGSTQDLGPSQAFDNNKTEVLRLFLVLLSRQIYVPSGLLASKPSLYTLYLVQSTPRRDVLTILCSLLNTAMNSTTPNDATIGGFAGKLPYNHLVFKGEDSRSVLVGICFQVLCAILDFQSGGARDVVSGTGELQTFQPTLRTNAFRYFVVKLHRVQDFDFILNGVITTLEQQIAATNNLLPGAKKSIPYVTETIIFLWKMLELNKKFRAYVLDSDKCMDVVAYLLCHALDIKDKPRNSDPYLFVHKLTSVIEQHGMCRALSYIIQTLSAEPAFGLKTTKPIKAQIPAKWHINGTAVDFLINAIYAVVATTSGNLNSLYPALIIALSNAAPYFKNLTVTASTRLVQLFTSFSNPLFLLSDEGHPRLLFFMLEVFNNVLLHNLGENPNLVYCILTSHRTFEDLGTFTLARGLREIRRVQLAKDEQAKNVDIKGKGRGSIEPANLEAGAEKARLLESEHELARSQSPPSGTPGTASVTSSGTHDESNPSSPHDSQTPLPHAQSEKARGKMKERRSVSVDLDVSLERLAAAGIGRNGFIPTQEWVTSWQQGLPLDVVMLVISELLPKVQELQATRHRATSASAIVEYLSTVSLKGVLPHAPPLSPRRFIWSDASIVWLTSLIWGEIYVRGMTPLGIWNATNVRLFYVKHAQVQQRQLTEAVTNVVGGLLRGNPDILSPTRQR
ncbi:hypothetical protein BDN72DRAFT_315018 [Pluteus cervinus]|uniref:Uncharacterized protein n=1 Tax=Pluteus cervinus TaxID=181527 RepID=A0ACD3B424_9AGAR|nr:hypothetical protein BDN72DRAFT_315018 [Pluteus cervinus]